MRIELPTKIPLQKVLIFCSVLACVELLEGTQPFYVLLVFCYFLLSSLAFNVAGGFTRPSGAYIFYYGVLVAGLGTFYKALIGQAADTHLYEPTLVMGVYVATLGALLLAAFVSRKLATTTDGVAGLLHVPQIDYQNSALGSMVIYFAITYSFLIFPGGNGSLLHALFMINAFLPLAILLGTVAAVRNSNGARSTSGMTWAILIYAQITGMMSFSKQAMFTPFVCWLLGIGWARFRLRMVHILIIAGFAFLMQEFLTPLSNVGRVDLGAGIYGDNWGVLEHHLFHPVQLHKINKERVSAYVNSDLWYYGTPQGILDRLTMLPNDSELMAFTAQGHYFGYLPIIVYTENWVPHIIDPHKLEGVTPVGGNTYAHEMGQLAEEDVTTGISYSPSAEAFHMDGWTSVLIVQPLVFILLFVTTDAICGDLRRQPWGLLPLLAFAHIAPEALLAGSIYYVVNGNIGTIFAVFLCGYVTPVFGRLLKGRQKETGWGFSLPEEIGATRAPADPA